eukprot:2057388-Prymnesium_polylepis.2
MAHDDDATRKVEQCLLERAHRIDVQVVGRLVHQQQVAPRAQQLRELHTIALAARQVGHTLLLIAALEPEPADVSARCDARCPQLDLIEPAGHFLEDRVFVGQSLARLLDGDHLDRIAQRQRPLVRLLLSLEHLDQSRLARAVGAHDAHDAAGRQLEREAIDEGPPVEALLEVAALDDLGAQPRPRRHVDGRRVCEGLLWRSVEQLLVARDARLRLGLPRLRVGVHPLQLVVERLLQPFVLPLRRSHHCSLLLEPAPVVALKRLALAALQLQNPPARLLQKVAVVGLQPRDALRVQVVGRLVEQEQAVREKR